MNMKQFLVATALVASLSTAALAANPAPADQKGKVTQQQKFDARKAKLLKHMGERISKLQERQACVQAAEDAKALKACAPKRNNHEEKGDKSEGAKKK